jgi:hypothetical protein
MLNHKSKARGNARKITKMLVDQAGSADLYRTIVGGPSGQRRDVHVAHVSYVGDSALHYAFEVQIWTPRERNEAGFARRTSDTRKHPGMDWVFWEDNGNDGIALAGYATSLSLGADVLVRGASEALRYGVALSGGRWEPYVPDPDYRLTAEHAIA